MSLNVRSLKVGGIVLCGGESSRMGRPKAWLPFGNELMLQRVVRLLGEVVTPIVVVAAPGQDLPAVPPTVEIVRDARKGRGPLQGLAAGLARIAALDANAAFATSTDVPFIQPSFIRRMIDLLGDRAVAVPRIEDRHHPLAAVYRISVLSAIERLLAEDRLRPFYLFDAVPTRLVEATELLDADPQFASLRNLNTPEEYETALRDARFEVPGSGFVRHEETKP